MKCLHCKAEIQEAVFGWVHSFGRYACSDELNYAEPEKERVGDVGTKKNSDAPAGGVDEEKDCGCGAGSVGVCESCNAPLCEGCNSGQYVDVMACGDAEACEVRLRRKAVADASRSLFPEEEVESCPHCGAPHPGYSDRGGKCGQPCI